MSAVTIFRSEVLFQKSSQKEEQDENNSTFEKSEISKYYFKSSIN